MVWWANGRWLFLLAIWGTQPDDVRRRGGMMLYSLLRKSVLSPLQKMAEVNQLVPGTRTDIDLPEERVTPKRYPALLWELPVK